MGHSYEILINKFNYMELYGTYPIIIYLYEDHISLGKFNELTFIGSDRYLNDKLLDVSDKLLSTRDYKYLLVDKVTKLPNINLKGNLSICQLLNYKSNL